MSRVKGYKVFNSDWTCRGFQYEVGETFVHEGDIAMCGQGFHFCQKASDCFNYYSFDSNNKVAEVEALDLVETRSDKSVTNKLHIIREISWQELLTIVNEGKDNTGLKNTGDYNTGYYNSGDYNTGNSNSGMFSTITPKITMFEKETDLTIEEARALKGVKILKLNYENNWWIYEENMTDEEKELHPEYKTTGGYLKVIPFKEACNLMWDNLDDDDKLNVLELPNFDARIFLEITGIDVTEDIKRLMPQDKDNSIKPVIHITMEELYKQYGAIVVIDK